MVGILYCVKVKGISQKRNGSALRSLPQNMVDGLSTHQKLSLKLILGRYRQNIGVCFPLLFEAMSLGYARGLLRFYFILVVSMVQLFRMWIRIS